MTILKTIEVRELDQIAQDRFAIPGILLMEHASLSLASVLLSLVRTKKERFLFVCGRGNNGGDGFAAARHLHNHGLASEVVLLGAIDQIRAGSDAALNAVIALKMGIPVHECMAAGEALECIDRLKPDHVVDAILGTGLSSDVRGVLKDVIEGINARGLDVTAVDVPSGLDADTGLPLGVAMRARRTVTFAFQKQGLVNECAKEYCGEIHVGEIGLPREVSENPRAYLGE
jgi:NAD(P)H-hydrate epimerase